MEKPKSGRGGGESSAASLSNLKKKRGMVRALREFCLFYHLPRREAKEEAKVKIPQRKKDGELGKRYTVAYKCAHCGELTAKPEMDHINRVGKEPDYPYSLDALVEYIKQLLAPREGWQCLCRKCHQIKTNKER